MSKKRRREKVEAPPPERGNNERNETKLWQIVTDRHDIFDAHIVPKLNGNHVKFFYDVNTESRAAIKRAGVHLADAFEIGEFHTKSTLSWALEKCTEKKERFCEQMALNGNVELLKFLRVEGCPWNEKTCKAAAKRGHLECLKYAHANGCPESPYYAHRLPRAQTHE